MAKGDEDDIWTVPDDDAPDPALGDPTPPAAASAVGADPADETEATQEDSASEPSAEGADDDAWAEAGPSPRTVRIAQIALVVVVLLGVVVVLALKSNETGDAQGAAKQAEAGGRDGGSGEDGGSGAATGKPDWPRAVAGRPEGLGVRGQVAADVTSTAEPGVYLWNDFDGWHLWIVSGPGVPPTITGTLTSNDDLAKAVPALEGSGTVTVDKKVATFDLPTDVPVTGIDFNPGFFGKRLVITLDGPDGPIPAELVRLGSEAEAAPYPLVIDKVPGG